MIGPPGVPAALQLLLLAVLVVPAAGALVVSR